MIEEYTDLISLFLDRKITAEQFFLAYTKKFSGEKKYIGGKEFDELDWLFAKLDDYNSDTSTFDAENSDIDEQGLREIATIVLSNLKH